MKAAGEENISSLIYCSLSRWQIVDALNFHCRIWNTEREAYGKPFTVCDRHLQQIRKSLAANFAPCWIEQIERTDRACEDCIAEENEED